MFNNISQVDKILFARHLAIMLKSGMPFSEALSTLKDQTDSKKMEEIIDYCIKAVQQGESLGRALGHYKDQFSSLFLHMIHVGEESGTLVKNLEYLSKQLKKTHDLKKKVKSAMLYPAIVMVMTLAMGAGLAFFIFPKLVSFFEGLDITLPLPTRILLWVAHNSREYGLYFILGFVGIVVGLRLFMRLKPVKYQMHRLLLRMPWIGPLMQKVNLAYFSRTLSTLLEAGINIVEAIEVTGDAMSNLVYKRDLKEAKERLKSGEAIGDVLKEKESHFPPITAHMIEVGEKTGTLSQTLLYLANFYEEDVDSATKNLGEVLEPVLLIIMGVVVGFIAVSIIMPIYKITQGLEV